MPALSALRAAAAAVPVLALAYVGSFLVRRLDRGFELTDEAYALIWAASPAEFRASASQFGHYTGLLYALAGQSIPGFRLAGLLGLLAAAALFAHALEGALDASLGVRSAARDRMARGCAILLAALACYAQWSPTPGYNWLNLIGLLLAYAGLFQGLCRAPGPARRRRPERALGALLLGVGAALSFLAKPSSAALLAPLALAWIALTPLREGGLRFAAGAAAASALLLGLHVVLFQDGPADFAKEFSAGLALLRELGEGYEPWQALRQLPGDWAVVLRRSLPLLGAGWWSPAVVGLVALAVARLRPGRSAALDAWALLAVAPGWLSLWRRGVFAGGARSAFLLGPGGLALALGALLAVALLAAAGALRGRGGAPAELRAAPFGMALLLLCGPVLYSFGSLTVPLRHSFGGFVFFAAAALALLRSLERGPGAGLAAPALCALLGAGAVSVAWGAAADPYRLAAPLAEQIHPVLLGARGAPLAVDARTRRYLEELQALARDGGWQAGTALLDLTGTTPGAAYALGAGTPGTPWLLPSQEGSKTRLAERALALVPAEGLRGAWVLTSTAGRTRLPEVVLGRLGLAFPEGYAELGRIQSLEPRGQHVLWRPRRAGEGHGTLSPGT